MTVLLIRRSTDFYIKPLTSYILNNSINYYILDLPNRKLIYNNKLIIDKSSKVKTNLILELIARIIFGLNILLFKDLEYDIAHILSWKIEKIFLFPFIKKNSIKIVNIYGEKDITNRINNIFLKFFEKDIKYIVFSNINFFEKFKSYLNNILINKVKIIIYPLENLYFIDKYRNDINSQIIKISCCQRAVEREQHFKIIDEILKIQNLLVDTILTFQLTYHTMNQNDIEYKNKVIDYINNKINNCNFEILTDFMSFDDLAKYRLENKIFINMKLFDQFSGAMVEALYSGSYVIAASWLPYNELEEKGIFYKTIDSFDELGNAVLDAIKYINTTEQIELKNNVEIMKKYYHPDVSLRSYYHFYKSI